MYLHEHTCISFPRRGRLQSASRQTRIQTRAARTNTHTTAPACIWAKMCKSHGAAAAHIRSARVGVSLRPSHSGIRCFIRLRRACECVLCGWPCSQVCGKESIGRTAKRVQTRKALDNNNNNKNEDFRWKSVKTQLAHRGCVFRVCATSLGEEKRRLLLLLFVRRVQGLGCFSGISSLA